MKAFATFAFAFSLSTSLFAQDSELILIDSFEDKEMPSREGDGHPASLANSQGDSVWQLTGEEDMFLTWDLPPVSEEATLALNGKILIPTSTTIQTFDGEKMKGVRVRARLYDEKGNSAISERILSPENDWQSLEFVFENAIEKPSMIGLEMIWFEGPIFLDDITVSNKKSSTDAELEAITEWFHEQSWMISLCSDLPKGVSISAQTFLDDEPGWYSVEVREFHTPESGYDPNVAPMVGMFRVSKDRSRILYLDVLSGGYGSIQKFIEDRNLW